MELKTFKTFDDAEFSFNECCAYIALRDEGCELYDVVGSTVGTATAFNRLRPDKACWI